MTRWIRVPIKYVKDGRKYGLVIDAYQHRLRYVLVHISLNDRSTKIFGNNGIWALFLDGKELAKQCYYNTKRNAPPIRWANRIIREKRISCK